MSRRALWLVFAVMTLLGAGSIGFLTWFEAVTVKTRTPPGPEARRNPYLALDRFLTRMGRPPARHEDARIFDALPAGGVVLLDEHRRAHMTPERTARLLAWARAGGHLIVAAEGGRGDDPLLLAFDVRRWHAPTRPGTPERDTDEDGENSPAAGPESLCAPHAAAARRSQWPQRFTVRLPASAQTLSVEFAGGSLCPGRQTPDWMAGVDGFGAQIIAFRQGQGQVTFVASLRRWFANTQIGRNDHAGFLIALLNSTGQDGQVRLVTRLRLPTLFEWLGENAREALLSSAMLLLLWLWRIVPRFGPPRPEPLPERRQLREHLAAVGKAVWREGGAAPWLRVARTHFRQRLAMSHPALADLARGEEIEALARLTGRSSALIASALHGSADTPTAFLLAMRTLRNLELSLSERKS